jgi:hypothetical protein
MIPMKARTTRYFVPDLSPIDRATLKKARPKIVFVAESPHTSEVEPDEQSARRPLCGAAGRVWWGMLSEILEGKRSEEVTLERLLAFCQRYEITVINAVQHPLDPKVAAQYPEADPVKNLGIAKTTGEFSFKKKNNPVVQAAITDLRERLSDPLLRDAPVWPLGNDADWFVHQALGPEGSKTRVVGKIPHPSAWWRRGGHFGRVAREQLSKIFSN